MRSVEAELLAIKQASAGPRSFFNALHCEGYGGVERGHNAPLSKYHHDAQFKFILDVNADATTSGFGAYDALNVSQARLFVASRSALSQWTRGGTTRRSR